MAHFSYSHSQFCAENVQLAILAQTVSTPFYCYSATALRQNFCSFQAALQQALPSRVPLIAYALKANSNPALLRLLAREGAGADVVSGGELRCALKAGIAPQKIVFSGVGKTVAEIDFALEQNIACFNVESAPELQQIAARARALGRKAPISLRINPDIDAGSHAKITTGRAEDKFGIALSEAPALYHQAAHMAGLEIKGIDIHIGSQICDLAPFDKAFAAIAALLQHLRHDGHKLQHIDVGGGLGIDYHDGSSPPSVVDYARLVAQYFGALDVDVFYEPGRLLVGNAGILVTEVLYCKQTATKNFIIVDAAMNDFIRPTLYEAYHKIIPVKQAADADKIIKADVVGPVCESGDYLAKNVSLPYPKSGDLLAVMSAGAYGAVMASTYNSRPLVPEVLVSGDGFDIVRRRPSWEEMEALETVPAWLK